MTLTLLFARHGETHHNVLRRLSTAPPGPPLNATGRLQAEQLAKRVTGPVDALYSSGMTRAVETARIVGTPRGLTVHVDDDLRELSAGELDGGTDDATFDRLGRVWDSWVVDGDLETRVAAGGETGAEVLKRFGEALRRIGAAGHSRVLVIAHGGVIQLGLPALCTNLAADHGRRTPLPNCETAEVVVEDGRMRCVSWGGVPVGAKAVGR
ncbi:histidine phosphatase family protein [Streptomyces koyangensis]